MQLQSSSKDTDWQIIRLGVHPSQEGGDEKAEDEGGEGEGYSDEQTR
jgi:hypothetical protein